MNKVYIGIDNGVTGSIGVISNDEAFFVKTPVKSQQNYTKAKQNITRIDIVKMDAIFSKYSNAPIMVLVERPMVNPTRFKATTSALRALESTICFLEYKDIPFDYIDSKEWQRELLPKGVIGIDLKKASLDIGSRLFPSCFKTIEKQKDADGLLIAEYCRRKFK